MNHTMERSKIQGLYDFCNFVFSQKNHPLTFQNILWLRNLLDNMEAIDVGINEFSVQGSSFPWEATSSPNMNLIYGQGVSEITYIHIHECDNFSIGVFCFPAGGTFPLHDHPGMTVLSKILYGSMYVKAYDWVKIDNSAIRTLGLGATAVDAIFTAPCETSILFPRSGGNIHKFTALTPCAVLDVLSPPYSQELGRPSTYFSDMPIPSLPGYAILEERDLPDDLVVTAAPYLGPQLIADIDFC